MGPRAALGVLLVVLYASFYSSVGHNEAAHLDLARSLGEDGRLEVDPYRYNSADLIVKDGRTYSNKAPGAALLAVGPFVLARALVQPLGLPQAAGDDLVVHVTTLASVGLLSALAAVVSFGLVSRDCGASAAAAAALALWLATPLFPFSTMFYSHALSGALLALGAARVLDRDGGHAAWRDTAAGSALGFAVTTEYPAAVAALPLLLLGLATRPKRGAAALLLGFVAGLAPLAAYQRLAFGSALFPSYQAYLEEGRLAPFPGHARGFLGVAWPGLPAFVDTLAELTVGPERGLLRLCPVLVLALPGLALMVRAGRRREAAAIAAAAAALLFLNACYGDSIAYWGGGTSLGPRLLIPALPLLALPLGFAARGYPRAFLALALASGFVMLMGAAIEARVPYEIDEPVGGFLLPRYLRGEFALHRGVVFTPGVPGAARNLGGLLGLPGPWQLVPIALVALLPAACLLRGAGVGAAARAALAAVVLAVALVPGAIALASPQGALVGLYSPDEPAASPRLRRDRALDFEWGRDAPLLLPFRALWRGTLRVERAGEYGLRIQGEGDHAVELDGRELAAAGTARGARVLLSRGEHALVVASRPPAGARGLRLLWTPPGSAEEPIPPAAFVARP